MTISWWFYDSIRILSGLYHDHIMIRSLYHDYLVLYVMVFQSPPIGPCSDVPVHLEPLITERWSAPCDEGTRASELREAVAALPGLEQMSSWEGRLGISPDMVFFFKAFKGWTEEWWLVWYTCIYIYTYYTYIYIYTCINIQFYNWINPKSIFWEIRWGRGSHDGLDNSLGKFI